MYVTHHCNRVLILLGFCWSFQVTFEVCTIIIYSVKMVIDLEIYQDSLLLLDNEVIESLLFFLEMC